MFMINSDGFNNICNKVDYFLFLCIIVKTFD